MLGRLDLLHGRKKGTPMNCSRRTCAFRSLSVTLAALPLLLALIAPALGDCPDVSPPAGNSLALQVYAAGVQTYRWNGTSWLPAGPVAVLYTDAGGQAVVGSHYASAAGPTRPAWESISGSKVVGMVDIRCEVDPAAIPWLRLKAVSSEGPGVFKGVTYIQRVNTVGGLAPRDPGDFEGEMASVDYTAEYFFYKADD
jgi:hypothetical protein